MKRILAIIFSIIILSLCCACGSSKPTIEGDWYHVDSGNIYTFKNGNVIFEKNSNESMGKYELNDAKITGYISKVYGTPNSISTFYIIDYKSTKAITTDLNDTKRILFCKSKEIATQLLDEHKKEWEETSKKIIFKYETKPSFTSYRTKKPLISSDFNENNNHTAFLENDKFDLPKIWKVDTYKDILGVYFIPQYEEPPIFSLIFLNVDNDFNLSSYSSRKTLADSILNYYQNDLYKNKIDTLEMVHCYVPKRKILKLATTSVDVSGVDYLYIGCKGKIQGKDYFGLIKVRRYGEGISAFNLFQYTDSKYDFTNDMESIFATLKSTKYETYQNSTTQNKKEYSSYGSTSDLDISFSKDYIDGNKMYLKVYVKNNSSAMFKGDIHIFFYAADGKKRLGSDMIIIDKLMPGQTSWAKVKIDKYLDTPKIETEFTNPQFLDISPIASEIDTELSKKTSNSVRLNFDIASWYKNIESIEVYTDGTCVVISTSVKDNSTIASAVWSCGKDYGVRSVQVIDTNGTIKAVYPNK